MSRDQPEWLSLPEAVQALHWLPPETARRLIGEALSEGGLQDRPTSISVTAGDPHLLRQLIKDGETERADRYARPTSTNPLAWREWLEAESVDWSTGEVHRPAFKNPYRPQISRSVLLERFPGPDLADMPRPAPHRPRGSGFAKADAIVVERIVKIIEQEGISAHAATTRMVGDGSHIQGGSNAASKVRRLVPQVKKRLAKPNGE